MLMKISLSLIGKRADRSSRAKGLRFLNFGANSAIMFLNRFLKTRSAIGSFRERTKWFNFEKIDNIYQIDVDIKKEIALPYFEKTFKYFFLVFIIHELII